MATTPPTPALQLRRIMLVFAACAMLFAAVPSAEAADRSERTERLRLACGPELIDGQRGVLCRWSEAKNPHTRGYKLYRIVDGAPRELVATVGVDGRRGHFDTDVAAPSQLIYGVVSVDRSGNLLGRSAPVRV